ncbi:hypothetical protein KHC23_07695 [Ancylobacter dichloromethanicus]|uniref:Uncharacterized protein n=1 Tax=Ancylobacter dichloromethanicus TaxID=518825 RepID=A0A9W6JAA1_9HYPH|nr:hypothetical protein [Ancylobacter dichloromethanicus]MBS7553529.1 hypothetical protein [Ancylobacter dichloromethanicus]GLK72588.1 hypothetical protein GCM10017643_27040 [Ancylobacter dichloromethanicus]
MPRKPSAACPHDQAQDCPLYWASHGAGGLGCDDGELWRGGCAVDRGLDYTAALARLQSRNPRLVAECAWRREARAARAQGFRNMRAAGLH